MRSRRAVRPAVVARPPPGLWARVLSALESETSTQSLIWSPSERDRRRWRKVRRRRISERSYAALSPGVAPQDGLDGASTGALTYSTVRHTVAYTAGLSWLTTRRTCKPAPSETVSGLEHDWVSVVAGGRAQVGAIAGAEARRSSLPEATVTSRRVLAPSERTPPSGTMSSARGAVWMSSAGRNR